MDRHESLLLREQYLCQANTALPNSPGYPVQGTMNKESVWPAKSMFFQIKKIPKL